MLSRYDAEPEHHLPSRIDTSNTDIMPDRNLDGSFYLYTAAQRSWRKPFSHLMYILLVEHICSYAVTVFREYDIRKNGKIDINGVLRAPRESLLANFEIFFDCILFGYTIKLMYDQDMDDFHYNAYQTYWIIIDMIIMFCTQPYIVMCQKFQVNGEITKNLYSLYFVQQKKMDSIKLKIIQQELEGESDDEDEKLSVYSADLKNLDNDSAAAYSSDGDKKEKLKKEVKSPN